VDDDLRHEAVHVGGNRRYGAQSICDRLASMFQPLYNLEAFNYGMRISGMSVSWLQQVTLETYSLPFLVPVSFDSLKAIATKAQADERNTDHELNSRSIVPKRSALYILFMTVLIFAPMKNSSPSRYRRTRATGSGQVFAMTKARRHVLKLCVELFSNCVLSLYLSSHRLARICIRSDKTRLWRLFIMR
jgi:hypothetical protein